jgi:phosphoenolpyruvate carboxykinase (ATP)
MRHEGHHPDPASLEAFGLDAAGTVHWNLTTAELYAHALFRGEGQIVHNGPLAVDTGRYTGRSPRDRFIVRDARTEATVDWGPINQPMDPAHYDAVKAGLLAATHGRDLFVQDVFVGTHPDFRVPVRVVTEYAWHALFVRNLFVLPTRRAQATHDPAYTLLNVPSFAADPTTMGTRSETVVAMNLSERVVLIGSTEYAGEMKKSAFAMMNFELPERGVMPMHCSANVGPDDEVAVFFGLSGTGKTTLSATRERTLIGDDEHGWSDDGVFNFEGGCYAKIENLSPDAEPEIYGTTRAFATILENVVVDEETRRVDLADTRKTQNMRAAYPISHIANASKVGYAGHPTDVVFLTADAFGVLPPLSKLTPEQVEYYFLSGYTAKIAGTERGVTEPEATFSACFGAPFMPRPPAAYAELLAAKMAEHGTQGWLVNTGWSGGPFGEGHRMAIQHTRALLDAAIQHRLDDVPTREEPFFGLHVPTSVPGVPTTVLDPRRTWEDRDAYDAQATKLAAMFHANFAQFEGTVRPAVAAAGPKAG